MGKTKDLCKKSDKVLAEKIFNNREKIQGGTFIVVDPSSKSMGLVLYEKGVQREVFHIKCDDPKQGIASRLKSMYDQLPDIENVDVMLVELVRPSTGHIYLTWSASLCMIKYGAPTLLELSSRLWRRLRPEGYIKSDTNDALLMGKFAFLICNDE